MKAMEEKATKMVEIANSIGQLETNIVTERTAKIDAEQHVRNHDDPVAVVAQR